MTAGKIIINDAGTVLSYEDSGLPSPDAQGYLTVILIHGSVFHGASFKHLVPYAAQYNIRFVFLNTRDYPGSTPYSVEELRLMDGGELAAQEAFMRDQGHEIAFFVERFVRAHNTPPISESEGARTGGVAIGAWSYGNIYHTALLAHVSSLPDETRALLERHLRAIVYLDASSPSVGVPTAEGVYHPLRDTALSPEERGEVFLPWVSTYFTTVPSLSEVSPGLLAARVAVSEDVAIPTVKRMTQSELASITHFNALVSNLALRQIDRSVYAANLRRALFDTGGACPGVKVLVLWADMSIGDCVWAAKGIADLVATDTSEKNRREVQFVKLEGSNHFVHWDDPEKLVRVLAESS